MTKNIVLLSLLFAPLIADEPPPSSPPQERDYRAFLFGSFLYWSASEGGTDYAIQCSTGPLINQSLVLSGSSDSLGLGLAPGFRTGIGCHFPWQNSVGTITYTWLNFNSSSSTTPGGGQSLFPLLVNPALIAGTYAETASGTWTLLFQNLDADFQRTYPLNSVLAFSPLLGIKSAWLNQSRSVTYNGFVGENTSATLITNGLYTLQDTNNFWGMGLKLGAISDWDLGADFHLSGGLNGGLLIGSFHVNQLHLINGQPAFMLNSSLSRIVPNLEFDIGVDWSHYLSWIKFNIRAAYEMQYWWGQNQFAQLTTSAPIYIRYDGNLAFQGLTLTATFTF